MDSALDLTKELLEQSSSQLDKWAPKLTLKTAALRLSALSPTTSGARGVTGVPSWDQGSEAPEDTEVFIQTQGALGEVPVR